MIATCSSGAFDHVKSLGATAAFDYKDPDCGTKIREYTKDNLTKVFDTIGKANAPKICADAISSTKGGAISSTLPYPEIERKDVVHSMVNLLTIFGKDFGYGEQVVPGNPEDFEFGKRIYTTVEKLLHEGKLKVHPPKVSSSGLEGIFDGMQEQQSGKASGVKLVYKL